MIQRITILEVVERFRRYKEKHPAWGGLHIVLDDGNIDNSYIKYCIESAQDQETKDLAGILLGMSKTQRRKMYKIL